MPHSSKITVLHQQKTLSHIRNFTKRREVVKRKSLFVVTQPTVQHIQSTFTDNLTSKTKFERSN